MLWEAYRSSHMKTVVRDFSTSQPPLSLILLQTWSSSSWVATAVAAGDPRLVPSGSAFATALIIWTNAALVYNNVNLEPPLLPFLQCKYWPLCNPHLLLSQTEPGRWGRKAALSKYPCIDLFSCKPQVTAPAIHSIYVDMGAAVGLFPAPLLSNSTSLPSCNTGAMGAARNFFTAPHYCCSSPEKRLPGRDKLCAGSVICVSSNFPLIHLYILDGKHSLGAAINHAAAATKDRPASWGIAGACRGRRKEWNRVDALVREAVAWERIQPLCAALAAPTARGHHSPVSSGPCTLHGDALSGSRAEATAVSWPPHQLWMSIDCLKPATVLGCLLEEAVACCRGSWTSSCSLHPPQCFVLCGGAILQL